jgi:NAD(P)-dependent dehydrogenase (short-subunit alcohol dehydrogenase family)
MATNTNNYNSRIALITGGTKGIGLEVARQLAHKGIEVLIGSRDEIQGENIAEQLASENLPVTYIQIDVTNQATIDLAVTEVANAYGRLDILINNSSVYLKEPRPSELTLEMIRQNFEVNFFGAFAVTKAFLPLLRQSSSGHIINISSPLGSFYYHETNRTSQSQCAYSTSKTSLNMLTLLLAKDLKGTKIKVNGYAPSLTATQLTHSHDHAIDIAVKAITSLATLFDDNGPTGKIFAQDNKEDKW